jgi:hypothetical protein
MSIPLPSAHSSSSQTEGTAFYQKASSTFNASLEDRKDRAKFMARLGSLILEQSALTGPNLELVNSNIMEASALKIEALLHAIHDIGKMRLFLNSFYQLITLFFLQTLLSPIKLLSEPIGLSII